MEVTIKATNGEGAYTVSHLAAKIVRLHLDGRHVNTPLSDLDDVRAIDKDYAPSSLSEAVADIIHARPETAVIWEVASPKALQTARNVIKAFLNQVNYRPIIIYVKAYED